MSKNVHYVKNGLRPHKKSVTIRLSPHFFSNSSVTKGRVIVGIIRPHSLMCGHSNLNCG
ncbi:hypothetical protein HanRHA438_Chr04g0166941 [Helianthus annuus]|nr:hypothetical protein HanIR_Chr04g0168831 [Helianthus annuus]KAJ0926081.1 hypothetical protein HanRHA438_Chr04g0166941 [Helianthus annuus]